jgi:hypothetical protein
MKEGFVDKDGQGRLFVWGGGGECEGGAAKGFGVRDTEVLEFWCCPHPPPPPSSPITYMLLLPICISLLLIFFLFY